MSGNFVHVLFMDVQMHMSVDARGLQQVMFIETGFLTNLELIKEARPLSLRDLPVSASPMLLGLQVCLTMPSVCACLFT